MTPVGVVEPIRGRDTGVLFRRVFVRDLLLHALVGVYHHERDGKQRVRINVDLTVEEGSTPIEDALDNVVSYETIVDGIRGIVESGHVNLVETLAENIAALCLEDRRVRQAVVRVEKLDVFPDAAGVGVEIERENPKP
jgi:dihydroneopterin aldolase